MPKSYSKAKHRLDWVPGTCSAADVASYEGEMVASVITRADGRYGIVVLGRSRPGSFEDRYAARLAAQQAFDDDYDLRWSEPVPPASVARIDTPPLRVVRRSGQVTWNP